MICLGVLPDNYLELYIQVGRIETSQSAIARRPGQNTDHNPVLPGDEYATCCLVNLSANRAFAIVVCVQNR